MTKTHFDAKAMGNLMNDLFLRLLIALSVSHGYGAIGRLSVITVFAD
ncbi:MAG: hypothetical protein NTY15_07205 [Planctomycetota bacterium]|nr:hypothetical protein [Planctomycetota bacterium]